jgi:hydrogenase/urease accessory protein HupE
MSLFELYQKLGFKHIIDINGYDHIIFILALCAAYSYTQIKKILILVTAFTVGHSVTLALATLKMVTIPSNIIEFLIPVTILITTISNLFNSNVKGRLIYLVTLFFGLIHGLGFSNYLKELLGKESNIVSPLLAFNIGLEIGQILIVVVNFAFLFLAVNALKVNHKNWKTFISGAAFGIAVILIIENKIW